MLMVADLAMVPRVPWNPPFCQTNPSKQPHNSTKHSDQFYFSKLALDSLPMPSLVSQTAGKAKCVSARNVFTCE